MLNRILMVAAVLVLGAAAPAAAQYPAIIVNPQQVVPGGEVSVEGSGCAANVAVVVTLKPSTEGARAIPAEGIVVANVTADAEGEFNTSFVVPAEAEPGSYDVVVECGDVVRTETIEVLGTEVTTPPTTPGTTPGTTPPGNGGTNTPNGSGDLPRTGSDLNGYGLAGAGLLTVGGLFLLGARKRRSATI